MSIEGHNMSVSAEHRADYQRGYEQAYYDCQYPHYYLMVSYTADTPYGHGYHQGVVDFKRQEHAIQMEGEHASSTL